ncbi:MAG TPA: DsbC family protein [Burkholderiales bacterium]|nr:DsbC family protein [Burkholderiales bacterium]
MYRTIAVSVLAAASFTAASAETEEAGIRQAFVAKFPKMSVESVSRTPFAGIYEVVVAGDVFYTDAKLSYLFSGNLLDVRSGQPRNITQETNAKLASGALVKATDFAVKRVKGSGKRVVYTFEDPNCGYCKELQKELAKLNDVTIYTFLWPILSPDSVEKSKAIWCSKDRAKSWEDYMIKGVALKGKTDCDTSALERNAKLAQRFNLKGTPAIYIASGEQVGGYVPAEKLEAVLSGAPAR